MWKKINRYLYVHVAVLLCLNADLEIGDSKCDILVSGEGLRAETKVSQVVFAGWIFVTGLFVKVGDQGIHVAIEFFNGLLCDPG